MYRLLLALFLFVVPSAEETRADNDSSLMRMMKLIPADAKGIISFSDISASQRQIAPFAKLTTEPTRAMVPYTTLYHGLSGFDMSAFGRFIENGASDVLGFSIFDISMIAGWGELPAAPVIISGATKHSINIEKALLARKFKAVDYNGHKVWNRGQDYEIDMEQREQDPFAVGFSFSQRFAMKGDFLLFSRSWPTMNKILDVSTSLADNPDAVAILNAGYMIDGVGDLVDVVMISGQPETAPSSKPDLPPFPRYGLLRWLNGATMTGAIVIPYVDAATASTARDRFTTKLDTRHSRVAQRPFSEILTQPRHVEIIQVPDRAVLIYGFQSEADTTQPANLTTFMSSPGSILIDMFHNRDLELLIGHAK